MLVRFGSVGVLSTFVYVIVANALIWLTTLSPTTASVAGYVAGMAVSFVGQSRFTFGVQQAGMNHVARFCIMSVIGLLISYGCVRLATDGLHLASFWGTLGTAILVPVFSFVVMKLWVFRKSAGSA